MIENATNLTNATALVDAPEIFKDILSQHLEWIIGLVIGVITLAIIRYGILPDIEARYVLKKIEPEYITFPVQQDFFDNHKGTYGDLYSHLILFNGGRGKASNIKTEYNWIVNGEKGGVCEAAIKKAGHKLLYDDYLFPGQEQVSVPAFEYRSTVFEEAERILIRIRYKDSIACKHCRCTEFVSIEGRRGYHRDPKSHNHCGPVKLWVKRITRGCVFSEDVCSVEGLIPIIEEDTSEGKIV